MSVCQELLEKMLRHVYIYATELLSLGLLWHGFHDAIREADGDRILRYWKILLVVFNSSNSAKEVANLLIQYHYAFSERQRAQLLWSRCVNTKAYAGTNFLCDFFFLESLAQNGSSFDGS